MSGTHEPARPGEEPPSEGLDQQEGPAGASDPLRARLLRADAERNRQRILEAAAEVFTERGFEATLDEVARRAGVGVGTVYRRFPDKASLAEALFTERIDELVELAERAQGEPDAWAALVSFLERAAGMLAGDRGLRQLLLYAAAQGGDKVEYARDRMRPAVDRLVKRAQAEGQVRADLGATDIPLIEFMLAAVAEYTRHVQPGLWRRYLALILDALGPARASTGTLPEPELTAGELVEVMNSSPLSYTVRRKA
jgi:AcrR family transcriptional regulator